MRLQQYPEIGRANRTIFSASVSSAAPRETKRRHIDYRRYARPCQKIIQTPVISRDGPEEGPAAAQVANVAGTVCLSRRVLRFRRGACRHAGLADLYRALGKTFLRGRYHQILGPRRHLPKFANGLCRHAGACVRLDLHLGRQTAESYVERSNAFALVPGHGVLADCSAVEQAAIDGTPCARHRLSEGTGRSKGSQTSSCVVPNALEWRLGRGNSAILLTASRDERGNGTRVGPSLLTRRRNFRIIRREAPRQGRDVAPRRAWARAAARAAPTPAGAAAAVQR